MKDRIVCACGKGYASSYDNMCCFCRESVHAPTRRLMRKFDLTRRGQGLKLEQYFKYKDK